MKAIAFLMFAASAISCSSGSGSGPAPRPARFLALGDSYTIGESVAVEERWPMQLAARLREGGFNIENPEIVAKTGWTTDELNTAIDAATPKDDELTATPKDQFDLVTLLIGVNNQYRGRDPEEYRGEFRLLLERAIDFAGGDPRRVIVVSIPDWGVTPFAEGRDRAAIARAIDRYNAVNRAETARAGSSYVDITPGSRNAATDRSLVASDGLHPSAAMYDEWTTLILPHAARILTP